jgi:hypothetical protein
MNESNAPPKSPSWTGWLSSPELLDESPDELSGESLDPLSELPLLLDASLRLVG